MKPPFPSYFRMLTVESEVVPYTHIVKYKNSFVAFKDRYTNSWYSSEEINELYKEKLEKLEKIVSCSVMPHGDYTLMEIKEIIPNIEELTFIKTL